MGSAVDLKLERHRQGLTGHCRRMLGSSHEAEDAVQEAMVRAWRGASRFEGRAQPRTWLYRIATNVCLDMMKRRPLTAEPVDVDDDRAPALASDDPADRVVEREETRLALIAALRHLPPRQRAVLILRDVLRWKASEVAELLGCSLASVNSALQRARSTLAALDPSSRTGTDAGGNKHELLAPYVDAFARVDIDSLVALVRLDASTS